MRRYLLLAAGLLSLMSPCFAVASAAEKPAAVERDKGKDKERDAEKETAKQVVSTHAVTVGGKRITYTATAGQLPITTDDGEPGAEIFLVSYVADNPEKRQRPLIFAFNGGPGAAAVWLHLGALGPRRVEMLPDGNMPQPPYRLVDNDASWLDVADLVFVDPVGTGFSRASKPDSTKNYTTVQGDIESLGKFIRLYLSRNQLWDRPIVLVGESYGSFRVAGLSEHLAEHGAALNGIILISTVMNMETISFDFGNDLPYALFLPSYTATAWYHKKLTPALQENLEKTLSEAEQWATTDYLRALFLGDRLSAPERQAVTEKLAAFTGLSQSFVAGRNLRIDNRDFAGELLKDARKMTGYMDSRFTAPKLDLSRAPSFDATVATIRPPYTSMMNSYLRKELGYTSDLEYFVLGGGIGHWDWQAKNSYADTSENLRDALAKNPYTKVFVASGVFDLATPHFASDYTLSHMGLTPEQRRNITVRRYQAGHMMYLETKSLAKLKGDVVEFLKGAVPQ